VQWVKYGSHDKACVDCVSGKYKQEKGDLDCDACPRGMFGASTGNISCTECSIGQYADEEGSIACKKCRKGRYGTRSSAPSADECTSCSKQIPHSVTLQHGRTSKDECVCTKDHYMIESRRECVVCPLLGVECTSAGETLHRLPVKHGFWRADERSVTIHLCTIEGACIGSSSNKSTSSSSGGDALCREGHRGPLCAVCTSGWAQLDGDECVNCKGASVVLLIRALGILLLIVAGVVGLLRCWNAHRIKNGRGVSISGLASIAHHSLPTWLLKLKIVISFLQVAGSFQVTFHVPFPRVLLAVFMWCEWFNFPLKYFSIGCVFDRDYYTDLQFTCIMPLVVAVYIFVRYRWRILVASRVERNELDPLPYMEAQHSMHQEYGTHFGYFVMLLYFMYPGVTANLFGVFQLEEYEDGSAYLLNDMSIEYGSVRYNSMRIFAIFFIFFYPFGIPFFIWFVLWRDKSYYWNRPDFVCTLMPTLCTHYHHGHSLALSENGEYRPTKVMPDKKGILKSMEFLVGAYQQKYWWFELFELFRKLVLTGLFCIILPGTDEQLVFATLACLFAFFVFVNWKPYRLHRDNALAIFSLFGLFLILYAGLIMKVCTALERAA
jgi:hypothetical protein